MVELNTTYRAQLQNIAKTLSTAMPLTTATRTVTELDNTINELIAFTESANRKAGLPPSTPDDLEATKLQILEGQVLNMSRTQDAKGLETLLAPDQLQRLEQHINIQHFVKSVDSKVSGMYPETPKPAKADTQLGTLQSPSIVQPPAPGTDEIKR